MFLILWDSEVLFRIVMQVQGNRSISAGHQGLYDQPNGPYFMRVLGSRLEQEVNM